VICCDIGRCSKESLLRSIPNPPETNLPRLAMLLRLFVLMSAVVELCMENIDAARPFDEGGGRGRANVTLANGLAIVDVLLVRLGTSSTDSRTSGPGSPKLKWTLSSGEVEAVPSLGVANDA